MQEGAENIACSCLRGRRLPRADSTSDGTADAAAAFICWRDVSLQILGWIACRHRVHTVVLSWQTPCQARRCVTQQPLDGEDDRDNIFTVDRDAPTVDGDVFTVDSGIFTAARTSHLKGFHGRISPAVVAVGRPALLQSGDVVWKGNAGQGQEVRVRICSSWTHPDLVCQRKKSQGNSCHPDGMWKA